MPDRPDTHGAMFFDSDSRNAFGYYNTRNEAVEAARVNVTDWSPFLLMVYGPQGRIIECLTDEDFTEESDA